MWSEIRVSFGPPKGWRMKQYLGLGIISAVFILSMVPLAPKTKRVAVLKNAETSQFLVAFKYEPPVRSFNANMSNAKRLA